VVTPDYFRAMSIPLRRGRTLTGSDGPAAPPVALINESMARRHWPGEDPVGKKIAVQFRGRSVREIVGVVADVRRTGLDSDPKPEIFVPYAQSPFGHVTFVVRTRSEAAALAPAVKSEIWRPDKTLPIYKLATIEHLIADSLADRRFLLMLLAGFAAAALGLAGLGIYGVIGYLVTERTAEIGLRMALGAGRRQILRLVLRQGAVLTLTGIAIGLAASLALTRSLRAFLFATAPADPVTFAATGLLLASIAMLASYLPARRAMGVDPMISLRNE
jgi:putative ABC transport system permease protein